MPTNEGTRGPGDAEGHVEEGSVRLGCAGHLRGEDGVDIRKHPDRLDAPHLAFGEAVGENDETRAGGLGTNRQQRRQGIRVEAERVLEPVVKMLRDLVWMQSRRREPCPRQCLPEPLGI